MRCVHIRLQLCLSLIRMRYQISLKTDFCTVLDQRKTVIKHELLEPEKKSEPTQRVVVKLKEEDLW